MNRKSQLKDDSNRISNVIWLEVDLIALAYTVCYDSVWNSWSPYLEFEKHQIVRLPDTIPVRIKCLFDLGLNSCCHKSVHTHYFSTVFTVSTEKCLPNPWETKHYVIRCNQPDFCKHYPFYSTLFQNRCFCNHYFRNKVKLLSKNLSGKISWKAQSSQTKPGWETLRP